MRFQRHALLAAAGLLAAAHLPAAALAEDAAAAAAAAAGGDAAAAAPSDVLVLTKDSFKSTVDPEKLILVEFYAPWCGHCQALAPHYEAAATELKNESIKLAKVDCTAEADLCGEHDVQGYPTIKVFREGKPSDYGGPRKTDGIISYMRKQALPAVSHLTAANVSEFSKRDKIVAIAYLSDAASSDAETFTKLAEANRDSYLFGIATDADAAAATGAKVPSVVLYRTFDEPQVVYSGKLSAQDELQSFLKAESVPLVDEVGPENFMTYAEANLPLAYLFVKPDYDNKEADIEALRTLAKQHKGKLNFVWIDAEKFINHAKALNIQTEDDWPAFVIQDIAGNSKYPLSAVGKDAVKAVPAFVKDFVAGKLSPSIKSEPVPKAQDGPVHVLVADEFDKVVFDDNKDVLVEFYAPWCGHCKKLAPTYDELGEKYKQATDKIVIAKMDATANDVPPSAGFQISSFPTIKFKPAGGRDWLDFDGDRTLDGFVEFIGNNAKNKVDLNATTAAKDAPAPPAAAEEKKAPHHEEL